MTALPPHHARVPARGQPRFYRPPHHRRNRPLRLRGADAARLHPLLLKAGADFTAARSTGAVTGPCKDLIA
jgi:hypothetical protein